MNLSSHQIPRMWLGVSRAAVGALLASTLASPVSSRAQTSADVDQAYSLQHLYKAGSVDLYKIAITKIVNGPKTGGKDYEIKMNLVMKETTKTVGEGGQVTLADEYTKAAGVFGGNKIDLLKMTPTLTLNKDKSGQVYVIADGGEEPISAAMSSLSRALLQSQIAVVPAKLVKVGDTWNGEISGLTQDDDTKTKVTVKLDGIEVIDGVKTLRLKTVTETTATVGDDTKIHGEGTMYVDTVTGKLVKWSSKADGTEKGAKVNSTMVFGAAGPEDAVPTKKDDGPK